MLLILYEMLFDDNCIFGIDVEHGFSVYGVTYKTIREYVMVQKACFFNRIDIWEKLRNGADPKCPFDWYNADLKRFYPYLECYIKDALDAVYSNEEMQKILVDTGTESLGYATSDAILGLGMEKVHIDFGGEPHGKNIYGKYLEHLRDTYKQKI